MATATVPVKSGWRSKINWAQFAGPLCSVLAIFGLPLTPEEIAAVILGFQTIQSIVTWILRQFFTKSVTASSVGG